MSRDNGATKPTITFAVTTRVGAPPEVTFGVLADPRTHLESMGREAPADNFKLLTMESGDGPARVGTVFTSTGSNGMGMVFHDRSEVIELSAPRVFAFTTSSRLVRKHRRAWQARFEHRYEVVGEGAGSRIEYTARVFPLNYRPYWLHPMMRPMTGIMVPRMMGANLRQFAKLAERTAASAA